MVAPFGINILERVPKRPMKSTAADLAAQRPQSSDLESVSHVGGGGVGRRAGQKLNHLGEKLFTKQPHPIFLVRPSSAVSSQLSSALQEENIDEHLSL